jgi:hypothetical protein
MLALVQAPRLIDPHPARKPSFFGQLLQSSVQFALPIGGARRPRRIGRPCIVADKNVAFKSRQA